jgi:hypothetical protein
MLVVGVNQQVNSERWRRSSVGVGGGRCRAEESEIRAQR